MCVLSGDIGVISLCEHFATPISYPNHTDITTYHTHITTHRFISHYIHSTNIAPISRKSLPCQIAFNPHNNTFTSLTAHPYNSHVTPALHYTISHLYHAHQHQNHVRSLSYNHTISRSHHPHHKPFRPTSRHITVISHNTISRPYHTISRHITLISRHINIRP